MTSMPTKQGAQDEETETEELLCRGDSENDIQRSGLSTRMDRPGPSRSSSGDQLNRWSHDRAIKG
jgi:hypothetical protein